MRIKGFSTLAVAVFVLAGIGLFVFSAEAEMSDADGTSEAAVISNGVEQNYSTLFEAFANAKDGNTVKMLKDVVDAEGIMINDGRSLVLDLNGKSVYFEENKHITIQNGKLEITGKGTLSEKEGKANYAPIILKGSNVSGTSNYSVVSVGADITLIGWAGVFVDQIGAIGDGVVVNLYGSIKSVKDVIGSDGEGIYVNGKIANVSNTAPIVNMYPGSSIVSTGLGMYIAGYAQVTMTGGSIQASTGIEIRAGSLNISGGNINATGIPTSVTPNGNGSTTDGAAIAVSQHTTKNYIDVVITGGTFSGFTALYESNPQANPAEDISKVKINISGGTFATNNGGTKSVYSEDFTGFITGGVFSNDVSEYVKSGVNVTVKDNLCYVGAVEAGTIVVEDGSVSVSTTGDNASFIVPAAQESASITATTPDATIVVDVTNLVQGAYSFTVKKVDNPQMGSNVLKIETPGVTISSITVSVPISVPSGYQVIGVKAYYYNEESGEREYLSDVSFLNGMISFVTNHNSYYGYEYTTSLIYDDDDEPYFPPTTVVDKSSEDDDKTTVIIACAAAAAAAALAMLFFLVDSRRP